MVDMDCVAKAIECCKKYPYYQANVILHDWIHYYEIYKELIQPIKSFYCESLWHCREFYFENGAILTIQLDDDCFHGRRTNCLVFDDAVSKEVRNSIFRPMIVNYTQKG